MLNRWILKIRPFSLSLLVGDVIEISSSTLAEVKVSLRETLLGSLDDGILQTFTQISKIGTVTRNSHDEIRIFFGPSLGINQRFPINNIELNLVDSEISPCFQVTSKYIFHVSFEHGWQEFLIEEVIVGLFRFNLRSRFQHGRGTLEIPPLRRRQGCVSEWVGILSPVRCGRCVKSETICSGNTASVTPE